LKAKLKDVTPHILRHTFASVAGDLGFSELTIAGLLGHSARRVTDWSKNISVMHCAQQTQSLSGGRFPKNERELL